MKKLLTAVLLLSALMTVTAIPDGFLRSLQSLPPPPPANGTAQNGTTPNKTAPTGQPPAGGNGT